MKQSYDKNGPIGYALGVFPSLELLDARPEQVRRLLIHPQGAQNAGVDQLMERCAQMGVPVEEAPRVLERLAGKGNCYAALAFEKYAQTLMADKNHLLLHNPGDMGNLGTILRTAAGFGIEDIAIVRPAADVFDPRVVRSSMGAVFRLRVQYFDHMQDYDGAYASRSCYFFRLENAQPIGEVAKEVASPSTLVFGNESSGLPTELIVRSQGVIIPHTRAIDSLNLAVAVGIGLQRFYGG